MAITKSQILTAVNKALEREETDIDLELNRVLQKLSSQANFLADIDTSNTIDFDSPTISYPDYFRQLNFIRLLNADDNSIAVTPHLRFTTYGEYLNYCQISSTPYVYTEFNNEIYFYPTPNIEYTVEISFFKIHPPTPDDILFDDKFLSVLSSGTILEVAYSLGLTDQIKIWRPRYIDDIDDIKQFSMEPARLIQYNRF